MHFGLPYPLGRTLTCGLLATGFGDALGLAGQQTFGVKAQGIHKFTMGIAIVFLGSALTIHVLNRKTGGKSTLDIEGGTSTLDGSTGIPIGDGQ